MELNANPIVLEAAAVLASPVHIGQHAGDRTDGVLPRHPHIGRSDMQMMQLPSPRPPPGVAPHDKHGSRWKLGPFTWPLWRGSASTGSLTPDISSAIAPSRGSIG